MGTVRTREERFREETLAALDGVYRFALRLTSDPSEAEDLVQETFLIAYQRSYQYELGTNCTAWLFTICRHHWLQQRGRAKRMSVHDDVELEALAALSGAHWGHATDRGVFELPELAEVVERALDELPESYRSPVVIVDIEDQSYQTAAQVLGVPVGTVRSRLHRGRRILQKTLLAYAQDAGLAGNPEPVQSVSSDG